ncbi:SDR family oxidoreductase [Amycolatopsis sp. FDAARGOS 1241]|uniref:SDR family NAD(P)-dependent oxidoreductase n=1 Tax=Amycolatopsis sp. FDAARGOS 1241 TaxID=2778070 RepID=UPI00195178D1|nr:SDR family NAD(P)-dependent oxidoreductase [Amycolatopsis sp. FDAARGOS 1241]QRP45757.1 SDR family NAD(P)-dependent oxidoreductase [Amycolatopsis sp. FDAARGOS 1241]
MSTNRLDLQGRRTLITGAGSGIGRALALELASRGGVLALAGRRLEPLAETAALVAERVGAAHTITADLTADGEPERVVSDAVSALGGLDILINNAGNVRAAALEDIDIADIRAMIDLNLLAPILATRAALPHLRAAGAEHGHAALVGISSAAGLVGTPFYAPYAATKAGLVRFDEAVRRELHGSGIHVATVYPGPVDTPMMATSQAGADLGYGLRPVNEVAVEIVAGLEERQIDINTQLPERRAMQELNARDPLAVDAALAPKLDELRAAVSSHRSI